MQQLVHLPQTLPLTIPSTLISIVNASASDAIDERRQAILKLSFLASPQAALCCCTSFSPPDQYW